MEINFFGLFEKLEAHYFTSDLNFKVTIQAKTATLVKLSRVYSVFLLIYSPSRNCKFVSSRAGGSISKHINLMSTLERSLVRYKRSREFLFLKAEIFFLLKFFLLINFFKYIRISFSSFSHIWKFYIIF